MRTDIIKIISSPASSLYKIAPEALCTGFNNTPPAAVDAYIVSTPESRSICNDPRVFGIDYTRKLTRACSKALTMLAPFQTFNEKTATVLNILRGGLNFGLREALADAFAWNAHSSAFISAQRNRKTPDSSEWIITESSYSKIYLQGENQLILGDVVATGTSLEHGLRRALDCAKLNAQHIKSILFFTIGGPRSHEILSKLIMEYAPWFPEIKGIVVYFEGVFTVAEDHSPLRIKISGTDLLRRDSILAPDFIESQYENARFPLERCTIYDAGSRAFNINEYLADVAEYWQHVALLAAQGVTFSEYCNERMPEIDATRFGHNDLHALCATSLI
jgi:hypothetical protein